LECGHPTQALIRKKSEFMKGSGGILLLAVVIDLVVKSYSDFYEQAAKIWGLLSVVQPAPSIQLVCLLLQLEEERLNRSH
jgi:hypothetical protein